MKRILVLGGGFGGLWSAIGAARKLAELGIGPGEAEVTLVDQNDFHSIRVRNYEADLDATIVPFAEVLDPIGVHHVQGRVQRIDLEHQQVEVQSATGAHWLRYDRLVYALGSRVKRPPIPGLKEYSFDVDTYAHAKRLEAHLLSLASAPIGDEKFTVLVIGAGLTGIEIATDLVGRLDGILHASAQGKQVRIILADAGNIGSNMGDQACEVIAEALSDLHIETRPNVAVTRVDTSGVVLTDGERIPAATVIWCGGMQANELAAAFLVERDRFGRLPVDEYMRVKGVEHVFAVGDAASAVVCEGHTSVMSCQHGRPMGRYAGHNVAADLMRAAMLPLTIEWYTTILDLGPWGAVYTEGWDRHVVATRATAKRTKMTINHERICPPRNADRATIFSAAAPVVQTPPETDRATGGARSAC